MKRMKMPTNAMSDHISRLYDGENHVDISGAVIKIVRYLKNSCEIEISDLAIADFLADMDYQIEFNTEHYERKYKSQCQYAYKKMLENLKQNQ